VLSTEPDIDNAVFATTHWSVVLAAGAEPSPAGRDALEQLCRTYWSPIYAYARRAGHSAEDARDLTQGFFAQLIGTDSLSRVDPERGRFRSFLLGAFKHFLAHERDRVQALKRGGGVRWVRMDPASGGSESACAPVDLRTPDRVYDERWAAALLERVLGRLRQEFAESGRGELFDGFKAFLVGQPVAGGYAGAAARLGMTEGAAKMTVTRLRDRYRGLLRAEVAQTLVRAGDVDDELRQLLAILRGE
jgi:DNA-directed RNA polymerase specialized sigma24 family protein